ncbi:hypothetical protein P691DRAFT_786903 [Macrolepiota fuliginosa MF-IS2]|uniref:Uncharacterized protein n=1 Tax=Macrolepiota fuliginosa MF-IS2 TaxID=1400762 RepID=A0A9P5X6I7_9AGAR|nr:hypothetical protein P691DRAFT_786903 [Macrolepiota fuliginosa MF-IS2]
MAPKTRCGDYATRWIFCAVVEDGDDGEMLGNQQTLLALACVSPSIKDLALKKLWRSMNSLEPIVHVLWRPLNSRLIQTRTRDYLGILREYGFTSSQFAAPRVRANIPCFTKLLPYSHHSSHPASLHFPKTNYLILQRFTICLPRAALISFGGLEHLHVICEEETLRRTSMTSVREVLQSLPSLMSLGIDLKAFPIIDADSPPFGHPKLMSLILVGEPRDVDQLLRYNTFSFLTTLCLTIHPTQGPFWKTSWPGYADPQTLKRLKNSPLKLKNPPTAMSPASHAGIYCDFVAATKTVLTNINVMTTAWPRLETLDLAHNASTFPASVLIEISRHPSLLSISPSLDLRLPLSPLPVIAPLSESPLEKLDLTYAVRLPSVLEDKIALARNLFVLFPKLQTLSGADIDVTDLREVVEMKSTSILLGGRKLRK